MSWDAAGAIGEILGAIAVVVTILYLAREVRQNARALSITALRDITAQWNQWEGMLATSPDLAPVVAKGNARYAQLDPAERLRYGAYVQTFFDIAETYRSLIIDHRIDKDPVVLDTIVARRMAIPGFAAWWNENSADYSGEVARWIEGIAPARTRTPDAIGPQE